jgi:hypothetical protein
MKYGRFSTFIVTNIKGRCWSIVMSNLHSNISHSFISSDDLLLEFKSNDHHVLALLILPYVQERNF